MSTKHTPGPLRISLTGYSIKSDDPDNTIVAVVQGGSSATAETVKRWLPCADLLTHAYNSYDKHCGEKAVECAEEDLLGQALEALKRTRSFIVGSSRSFENIALQLIDAVLTKVGDK